MVREWIHVHQSEYLEYAPAVLTSVAPKIVLLHELGSVSIAVGLASALNILETSSTSRDELVRGDALGIELSNLLVGDDSYLAEQQYEAPTLVTLSSSGDDSSSEYLILTIQIVNLYLTLEIESSPYISH